MTPCEVHFLSSINIFHKFRICNRVLCLAEKDELVKTHATALKREQDEVATLKTRLAEINEAHKTEMDHAALEKTQLEEEMQKLRDAADTAENKASLAQEAARQFQARIDAWTVEFKKVQENMHGELSFPSYHFQTILSELSYCCCFLCSKLP